MANPGYSNGPEIFADETGTSMVKRMLGALYFSNDGGVTWTAFGAGAGFGTDVLLTLPNSAAAQVNALEMLTALAINTAGSEVSRFIIRLLDGVGANHQADTFTLTGTNGLVITTPNSALAGASGFRVNSSGTNATLAYSVGGSLMGWTRADSAGNMNWIANGTGTHVFWIGGDFGIGASYMTIGAPGTGGIIYGPARVRGTAATASAVATTVTLNQNGNSYPMTVGTGTLNAFNTTNFSNGDTFVCTFPSGVTITNNVAGAGGSVPILTPTGASIVTASKRSFLFSYDTVNFILVG